jgi:3-oxoacyl-[acyl-carrier protein] reductase
LSVAFNILEKLVKANTLVVKTNVLMKTIIITGGASGIGRVAAKLFAENNYAVAIWDVNESNGENLANELTHTGSNVKFWKVNTASFQEVENAASETKNYFGSIYGLINNAGITRDASLLKMSTTQWQQVIDVNLTGVFNCTKAVAPFLIENNAGSIINTSSVVGVYGNYGQSNYAAAKAGLIGLTKTWAKELGKHGITVNAVAPGFIATEMIETVPEKVIKLMKNKTPLGRTGTPADVAQAYLFLMSSGAKFITGTVLSVDGGLTL